MKRTRKQAASSGGVKRRRTDVGAQMTPDFDPRRLDAASSRRQSSGLDETAEHAVNPSQYFGDGSHQGNGNNVRVAAPLTAAEVGQNDASRKVSGQYSFEAAEGRSEKLAVDRSKHRWPKATEVGEDFESVERDIIDNIGESTFTPLVGLPSQDTESLRRDTKEQNSPTSLKMSGFTVTSAPPSPGSSDVIPSDPKTATQTQPSTVEDVLAGLAAEPAPDEARAGTVQARVFDAVASTESKAKSSRMKQKGKEKEVKLPAARGTRIRFDSEEPPTAKVLPSLAPLEEMLAADNHVAATRSHEEGFGESEDEAPETLSRISAVERNRALNRKVMEAVKQQDESTRSKRRKKQKSDEAAKRSKVVRLETKTGSAYSEAHASRLETLEDINSNHSEHLVSTKHFVLPSDEELPALLPDSVFEAVAPANLGPLDSLPLATTKPKSKVRLNDAKPIKDVKKGPLKVRVLEKTNPLLAPKASRGSEHLKNSWLKRGTGTGEIMNMNIGVHRRKINTGFLRRV